jgi:hypothetical protein
VDLFLLRQTKRLAKKNRFQSLPPAKSVAIQFYHGNRWWLRKLLELSPFRLMTFNWDIGTKQLI